MKLLQRYVVSGMGEGEGVRMVGQLMHWVDELCLLICNLSKLSNFLASVPGK